MASLRREPVSPFHAEPTQRRGEIKARDGLVEAVLAKSDEWKNSREGQETKDEVTSFLLEPVQTKVNDEVDKLCEDYNIPRKELSFHIQVPDVPHATAFQELLEIKLLAALQRYVGKIVDWFTWTPSFLDEVVKLGSRIYGWVIDKASRLVNQIFGEQISPQVVEDQATAFSESVHEQLMSQFREQIEDVRVWIK